MVKWDLVDSGMGELGERRSCECTTQYRSHSLGALELPSRFRTLRGFVSAHVM